MKSLTGSLVVCAAAATFAAGALIVSRPPNPTTPTETAARTAPVTAADGGPVGAPNALGTGSDDRAVSPPGPSAGATLTIRDFSFSAPTVVAGSTVTVKNTDSSPHTVTATDGSFRVSVPASGTASFVAPTRPGTSSFFCEIHPSMTGRLTVTA